MCIGISGFSVYSAIIINCNNICNSGYVHLAMIIVDASIKLRCIELALIVTIGVKLDCGNPTIMKGHSHGPVITLAVTVHCHALLLSQNVCSGALTLRGQLSQICDIHALGEIDFWQNSQLQFVLINRTFYANLHHQICFIMTLEMVDSM